MTKTFTFSGHSDDIVAVDGPGAEKLDNVYPPLNDQGELMCYFIISERLKAKKQLKVNAYYDGCWSFGVALADEDVEAFPFTAEFLPMSENGYTMGLRLTVPESAHIECFTPEDKPLDNGVSND
jgi:hypothetical protein